VSGRVLPFACSQHREVERLLPWLVNGTLDDDERVRVERHLDACIDCQQQRAQWQALQETCATSTAPAIDPMPAFTRLRSRLQTPRARPPVSRWRAMCSAWTTAPPWLRTAVAAPCAMLLALGGLWLAHEPAAPYRTLGDTPAASPLPTTDARLVVVFEPGASQAQTQQLLRASQARIIDGPNDVGAFVLAVPATRVSSVRDALRAAPGVRMVEALDAGSRDPGSRDPATASPTRRR
jgi:anti-sigma factor RsiW